jgi:hypothetical protein
MDGEAWHSDRASRVIVDLKEDVMKALPATLGTTDDHYHRLGLSRHRIELWEDGMRTDGGKGTYEIVVL